MSDTTGTTKSKTYPSAVYAAAGVGDLAYQQLRKLPEVAESLRGKANELAGRAAGLREQAGSTAPEWKAKATEYGAFATGKAAELTAKIDPERIRDSIVAGTQGAAERATHVYENLVARGERSFGDETGAGTTTQATEAQTPEAKPEPTQEQAKPAAPKTAAKPVAKKATKRQPRDSR